MSKTTSASKRKYNKDAYRRYEFSVGVDTKLNYLLEQYKSQDGNISGLIKELLCKHFDVNDNEIFIPHHIEKKN